MESASAAYHAADHAAFVAAIHEAQITLGDYPVLFVKLSYALKAFPDREALRLVAEVNMAVVNLVNPTPDIYSRRMNGR